MITPTDAIKRAFRQYAVFSRRATRAEFWWWILFGTIGSFALAGNCRPYIDDIP